VSVSADHFDNASVTDGTGSPMSGGPKRRVLSARPLVTAVHERDMVTPAHLCLASVVVTVCGARLLRVMDVELAGISNV
jgi:hypothetical protein